MIVTARKEHPIDAGLKVFCMWSLSKAYSVLFSMLDRHSDEPKGLCPPFSLHTGGQGTKIGG